MKGYRVLETIQNIAIILGRSFGTVVYEMATALLGATVTLAVIVLVIYITKLIKKRSDT